MRNLPIIFAKRVSTYNEVNPVDITPIKYTDVDYTSMNVPAIVKLFNNNWVKAEKNTRNKVCAEIGDNKIAVYENRSPMSFDIETTAVNKYKTVKGRKKAMKKCYYSASYMYKWQFGIDDTIVHGRTWPQFLELLDFIYQYNHDSTITRVCRVFVANLGFEFQFMNRHLLNNGWTLDTFSRTARNPMTATFRRDNFFIMFQDALKISNSSLDKLAKIYNLPSKKKVGDLDYSKMRNSLTPLTAEDMEYCSFDCRVLNDFFEWIYINYRDNSLPFPLTATGLVRHDTKYYFNKFERVVSGKSKKPSNFAKYTLPKLFPDTYEEYSDFMNNCYSGGFTHANAALAGYEINDVNGGDFTSSYPYTIMFQKFPMTPFEPSDSVKTLADVANNYAAGIATIFKAHFTGIHATTAHSTISISKIYEYTGNTDDTQKLIGAVVDNGRILYADTLTVYLTDLDYLENIAQFYEWDDVEICDAKISKYDYLPDYVRYACACFYSKKNQLKRAGMDGTTAYRIAKAFVNSIYGMMVERLNVSDIKYEDGDWFEFIDVVEGLTPEENAEVAYKRALFTEKGKLRKFLSPYWGAYVTAHARGNLFRILRQINNDAIYCDTDSIYYQHPDKWQHVCDTYNRNIYSTNRAIIDEWNNTHPADMQLDINDFIDLGEFDKLNKIGNYTRFITLGAKRYLKEGPEFNKETKQVETSIIATIAGLPKTALNEYAEANGLDPFEVFKNGMKIPDCKKAHRYNDFETTDVIVDEFGNVEEMHELASVGIFEIDFSMSLSSSYVNLLMFYAQDRARKDATALYEMAEENDNEELNDNEED